MSTTTILIIVLSLIGISLYININLLIKLEAAKDRCDLLDEEIGNTYSHIKETLANMKVIDSKGGFESDDEVGSVFDALKVELYKLEEL
tara:strand:+ start:5 stop:271 length:267 start_codon:yes stop_codon:yes gene_type:complete